MPSKHDVDAADHNFKFFDDPLAFVDPTVNLDAVLRNKRIGDAIKMLCKSIPGNKLQLLFTCNCS